MKVYPLKRCFMKLFFTILIFTGLLMLPASGEEAGTRKTDTMTAADIMQEATVLGRAPDMYLKIVMEIHTRKGDKSRTLEVYYKQDGPETRTLIQITEPAFLRKMKFLTHTYKDGSKARWLKTSGSTRRLSGADSNEPLFDSDFTVEDLSGFELDQFRLTYTDREQYNGRPCDVITAAAIAKNNQYSSKRFYVDAETGIVQRVDYLDSSNALVKQYKMTANQEVNGQIFPAECTMETFKDKSMTTIRINTVKTDKAIPDKYFNKGNL